MIHLSGTFCAVLFSVLFLLFINGNAGRAFLYIVLISSALSSLLLALSKNHFTVEVEKTSGVVNHGDKVEFNVTLRKKGFCFIPFVELCFEAGKETHLRTSLIFRKEVTISGSFPAAHSGLNKVTLKKVLLGDFLGIIRLGVPMDQTAEIAVMPQIIGYDGPEVRPNMLPSEEEETEEGVTILFGGMPGYEHREYVPGDSPRKINYKLSARQRKLMVRLDESNGYAPTNLYIMDNGAPVCCDKAFALAKQIVEKGGTVKITHKNQDFSARTPETLDKMREWLAFREFAEHPIEGTDTPPADANVIFSDNGIVRVAGGI